jgi:hypothetical protein
MMEACKHMVLNDTQALLEWKVKRNMKVAAKWSDRFNYFNINKILIIISIIFQKGFIIYLNLKKSNMSLGKPTIKLVFMDDDMRDFAVNEATKALETSNSEKVRNLIPFSFI